MGDLAEHELAAFRARVDRSTEHFGAFHRIWTEYLESDPSTLHLEVDDDGHARLTVHRYRPIPPELSLTLSDFLQDLRSGLDNCLYAIAILDSRRNPPPNSERLQWPIALTPGQWRTEARRLEHLSTGLLAQLEAIQPYNAQRPEQNALRLLHDLARADRHRTTHALSIFSAVGKVGYNQDLISDIWFNQGLIGSDGLVATFTWSGDRPVAHDDLMMDLQFDIELVNVEALPGTVTGQLQRPYGSLDRRLRAMHRAVVEYTEGLVFYVQNPDDHVDGDGAVADEA